MIVDVTIIIIVISAIAALATVIPMLFRFIKLVKNHFVDDSKKINRMYEILCKIEIRNIKAVTLEDPFNDEV